MSAQAIREKAAADADAAVGLDDAVGCDPHAIETKRQKAATTSPLRIPEPLVGGRSVRSKAGGQPKISVHVRVLARDRHREIESVGLQREIEIGGRKAGPLPTPRLTVTIALAQRLQEQLEVRFFAPDDRFHVAGAGMVLGVVGRSKERDRIRGS